MSRTGSQGPALWGDLGIRETAVGDRVGMGAQGSGACGALVGHGKSFDFDSEIQTLHRIGAT